MYTLNNNCEKKISILNFKWNDSALLFLKESGISWFFSTFNKTIYCIYFFYFFLGDYTFEATRYAIEDISKEEADDYIVIVLSDANFDR